MGSGSTLDVTSGTIAVASGVTLNKDGSFGTTDEIGDLTDPIGGVVTHALRDTTGVELNVLGTWDIAVGRVD